MVCLRMSLVASCYIWQCGLIWQVLVQFCCCQEGATGKIALGLISSLIRCTANIFDKDIWRREVHSSRLPSLKPEPFSLDCFRQHADLDKQCMFACRQAGRHTRCFSFSTDTEASAKSLQNHKYSSLTVFSQEPFLFSQKHHNVYKYNSTHCFMLVLLNNVHQLTWSQTICLQTTTLHARCWLQHVRQEVATLARSSTSVTLSAAEPIVKKWSLSPSVYLELGEPTWRSKLLAEAESLSGLWQLDW